MIFTTCQGLSALISPRVKSRAGHLRTFRSAQKATAISSVTTAFSSASSILVSPFTIWVRRATGNSFLISSSSFLMRAMSLRSEAKMPSNSAMRFCTS